ncbi:hypothetical protein KP509_27G010800 [Ceratopteris richardii]|nr:hypothetical protein KP509_27G010800 [Ceratopteris richardii]
MYGKCGLPLKAQEVFDTLRNRDVVTWTALISAYAQVELFDQAFSCFEQMDSAGVLPNSFTYTCLLKVCGSNCALKKGLQLHAEVMRMDLVKTSPFIGGALVDMYAKWGVISRAQEVFDVIPVRGVVIWTSLIAGYAQLELGQEALKCFDCMQSEGIKPNSITWASTLKACGSVRAAKIGSDIHAEINKKGVLKDDLVLGNALIDMYVKCGVLDKAQKVFDELPVHDVVSWNALIAGCVQHDYCDVALECLKQMQVEGVSPNAITLSSGLKACGTTGAASMGIEIHDTIARKELVDGDLVISNALIDMYAKCGLLSKAQTVFDELPMHDICSWNSLITGYAQAGETERVFSILCSMIEEGGQPDHVTLINVLYNCGHAGMIDMAFMFLKRVIECYSFTPEMQHLTCMVDLLARSGQTETAVLAIERMPFQPSSVMWHSVLSAYRKWGDMELGSKAFERTCELDQKHAAAVVSMCNLYDTYKRMESLYTKIFHFIFETSTSMRR